MLTIRPIETTETDAAFSLLRDVAGWLESRGRRQRIAATTLDDYLAWQALGGNWGVFEGDLLAAIFTLFAAPLSDWPEVPVSAPVPWIRALAVDPARRGAGVGAWALRGALAMIDVSDHLYLDCVSDFLPGYYERQGFTRVAQQVRVYPEGEYDITLLRHAGLRTPPAAL